MQPKRALSLFDSTCIIVGIIVGAGIFETAPVVAGSMGASAGIMGIWLVGGLMALAGALCYAELATAYPHEGGDYAYLNRAYGSWAGYLFGWSQLAIIRPGDIALMAFIFARYAQTLYAPFPRVDVIYAVAAVVVLTTINVIGVREGKWTQNLLTVAKAIGLLLIVAAGLLAPGGHAASGEAGAMSLGGVKLALILVMFTFGGWNEMAYVSAEVKRPEKNIARALVLGTVTVTVLYLLVNGAYLSALGAGGMAASSAVAVDTVAPVLPHFATRAVSVLICVSALGAVNGLVFTGARISYAMGVDHPVFRRMGKWNERRGAPVWALIVQGILSTGIILVAGSFIDTILYTAPVVWAFFLATGISLFVLRRIDSKRARLFRLPGYPFTPCIFCACAAFMLYSCVTYALAQKPVGLVVVSGAVIVGAVLYFATHGKGPSDKGGPAESRGH
ncbi:MAG: amino acid permease [bacterium]|nr:amino acid permease [bacterium]